MPRLLLAALSLVLVFACATAADAGLIVTVHDATIPQGGSGYVDVTVRSDSADLLDAFGIEFTISTAGPTALRFVSPPPDPQLTDPGYLFFGDSAAATEPPAGTIVGGNYIGGDGTLSWAGHTVGAADTLLVRLLVTAQTASPPQVGDTFNVSVVTGASTFFFDPNFADIPVRFSAGLVTIGPAQEVVPEPATAGLFGLALLGLALVRRGTRRPASA